MGGTIAGMAVGIGAATLLAGFAQLELALALVCQFLPFYAFQAAYGVMMFWITVMPSSSASRRRRAFVVECLFVT